MFTTFTGKGYYSRDGKKLIGEAVAHDAIWLTTKNSYNSHFNPTSTSHDILNRKVRKSKFDNLDVKSMKIGESITIPYIHNVDQTDSLKVCFHNYRKKNNLLWSDFKCTYGPESMVIERIADNTFEPLHNLVVRERHKQNNKHGFTSAWQFDHPEYYDKGQLLSAAHILSSNTGEEHKDYLYNNWPDNWDRERWKHLCDHSYKERLAMAASFICAHSDYLEYKGIKLLEKK